MFLDDLCTSDKNSKFSKLSESLNKDHGIDVSIYTELDGKSLNEFLENLKIEKQKIMMESAFNSYHNDPEYVRVVLLTEAIRIILKEIHPKRKRKSKTNETLDYKVHTPTGTTVDHDIDEDEPRPDLYWRKHQWEEEQSDENYPVEVSDAPPAGEAYSLDWETNNPTPSSEESEEEKMDAYAPNNQPVGGTAENEQQAGVYVAVMDPNRFLGDQDVNVMSIEPNDKSQNEVSPLSRKVARVMVDADETNNEDVEDMASDINIIKGLSGLLESSLLNENELQRAEIVFATNDIVMRLGKMIEDLSKMGTDDIMPLVDGIRDNFGPEIAEQFSRDSEELLQKTADSVDDMKQSMDTYREKFETHISDEDAQRPLDLSDVGGDANLDDLGLGDEEGGEGEGGLGDLIDTGVEAKANGELGDLGDELDDLDDKEAEEPLGRAKKIAESKVVNIAGKKVKLTLEQIAILQKARLLTEKINGLEKLDVADVTPATTCLNIRGKRIRITETQLKSLLFAKKFKQRVDEKRANVVRLTEAQAKMLQEAKLLTLKVRQLLEKKAKKDYDGDGKIETPSAEWKGSRDKAIKKAKEKADEKQSKDVEEGWKKSKKKK